MTQRTEVPPAVTDAELRTALVGDSVAAEAPLDAVLTALEAELASGTTGEAVCSGEVARRAQLTGAGRRETRALREHGRECDTCMPLVRDLLGSGHGRTRASFAELVLDGLNRAAALALLVAIAPLLVVLAVAVRLADGGPAFYRQTRIGHLGREFSIIKFRTMRTGADAMLAQVLAAEGQDSVTPFFKVKHDPRITRIGGFLRKTSLDELPQLINVVSGTMSLVGPRPQVDHEVQAYDGATRRRLLVRPGMTGLWQVSGRSDLDAAEGLELDLHYVRTWSPALDLRTLLSTPVAILAKRGAY